MADASPAANLSWDRYRAYLGLLARLQIPARLRAKFDASDLVQKTLLDAHQAAVELAGLTEPRRIALLRQMLANNLADLCRYFGAQARDVTREQSLEVQVNASSARLACWLSADQSTPHQQAVHEEDLLALANALAQLPQDQRLAVEMKHLQGYKVAEVAAALDRGETAVGGLLRRGMRRLRELLGERVHDLRG